MRAAGAEAAVDSILQTFLDSAPERIAAVVSALESGTTPAIERAAHAFKSAAAAIGAKRLADLLQQIETAGRSGEVAAARDLAARFRAESDAVVRFLSAMLGEAARGA
jgi:HPt (histidine-containing phosphotransfer) domain-containing protein